MYSNRRGSGYPNPYGDEPVYNYLNDNDTDNSYSNLVSATYHYKNILRKGKELSPEEREKFEWSIAVLSKHADDYQPLTSNLKDIVQSLSALPQDAMNAVTGPLRGKLFEDTLPFYGSIKMGQLGWKAGEFAADTALKMFSMVPGPLGLSARAIQSSKKLLGGTRAAVKLALSTYAGLTTYDIMHEKYDVKNLRAIGFEAEERTVREIMQHNLDHLGRNTATAFGILHSFGYLGKLNIARKKYNGGVDYENAERMNKITTSLSQETYEKYNFNYPTLYEEQETGITPYDKIKAQESIERIKASEIERNVIEAEGEEQHELTENEFKEYKELVGYEEPTPTEGEIITTAPPTEGGVTPQQAAGPTTQQAAQGPTQGPTQAQQAAQGPTPTQGPTQAQQAAQGPTQAQQAAQNIRARAIRYNNTKKNLIKKLKDRKTISTIDIRDTWSMTKDANGQKIFDPRYPVTSEEEIADLMNSLHRDKMDSSPDEKGKRVYFIKELLDVSDIGEIIKNNYLLGTLFENLERDGVIDSVKEMQELHSSYEQMLEMTKYIKGEPNNASPIARVYAENIKKLVKIIQEDLEKRGILVQDKENYLPQRASPEKIAKYGKKTFKEDLKQFSDLNEMGLGNATPQEIDAVMESMYNTFRRLDNLSDLVFTHESTGTGGSLKQRRRIHFKDATSHAKYLKKYGAQDNILEAIKNYAFSMAKIQGLMQKFGPLPSEVVAELINHMGSISEGSASNISSGEYKEIFTKNINNLSIKTMEKLIHNMANAYFYKGEGEGNPIWDIDFMFPIVRILNAAEGIGVNLATKNNAIYELLETPISQAFLKASYDGGHIPSEVVKNFSSAIEGLKNYVKDMSKEERLAFQKIGIDFQIESEIMPYNLSQGTIYDMPLWARKTNHIINRIKATDMLAAQNKKRITIDFQNIIGNEVKFKTEWKKLNKRIRGMLEGAGINKSDWNILLNSDVLVEDFLLIDIPDIDINSNLLSPRYIRTKHKGNKRLEAIAEKLEVLQFDYVQRASPTSQFGSRAAFLGTNAASRGIGAKFVKTFFMFYGYRFDKWARWISGMSREGHGFSKESFVNYAFQRMFIGLAYNFIRWGMAGKKPELETLEDLMNFIYETSARGELYPFSIASELFADYNHTQGYNFTEKLKNMAGSTLMGVGTQTMAKYAYNAQQGAQNLINEDYEKAFFNLRRAFPGSDFLPIDLVFNRLLLDNIFASIDEDGFYQLAQREMKINSKNHFKYFIEPGKFTSVKGGDISGATGIEGLEAKADQDFKEERKAYRKEIYDEEIAKGTAKDVAKLRAAKKSAKFKPEHPLYKEKLATNKKINKLKKAKIETDDTDEWRKLQSKINNEQAKYDLKVAEYYKDNKPKTISQLQAYNAYKRAKILASDNYFQNGNS